MARYEILEHTADVGLKAEGASLADAFLAATRGLAEIAGVWRSSGVDNDPPPAEGGETPAERGETETVTIDLEAADPEALLVDWLSEVIYLQDSRRAALAGIEMEEVSPRRARGTLLLAPLDEREKDAGTQIKAVTYHQIEVKETGNAWLLRVFFDI